MSYRPRIEQTGSLRRRYNASIADSPEVAHLNGIGIK
jgi:hypothetical protein